MIQIHRFSVFIVIYQKFIVKLKAKFYYERRPGQEKLYLLAQVRKNTAFIDYNVQNEFHPETKRKKKKKSCA